MHTYALITGASKGIGNALAHSFASENKNLLLVALPEDGLEEAAGELKEKYSVNVVTYCADLTLEKAAERFYAFCREQKLEVDVLVNNAGYGFQGPFYSSGYGENLRMVQLNMEAMVSMTRQFLPMLRRHSRAYVLNVGSIASFMSIPYKAVYAASKNFVLSFSNALYYELKDTNISVSCLCPGPVLTNSRMADRANEQGLKARMVILPVQKVARSAVEGMKKNKRVIVPGVGNKILISLVRYIPTSWLLNIAGGVFGSTGNGDKEKKPTLV